jgi:hypothetical protein
VAATLKATMHDDGELDPRIARNTRKREFVGIIEGNQFRIYRRNVLFVDYAGDFKATMFSVSTGTRIEGIFVKPQYQVLIPLIFKRESVNTATIGFTVAIFCFAGMGIWTIIDSAAPFPNVPLAFTFSVTIFAGLNLMWVLLRRNQCRKTVLNHLRTVLNARLGSL